jgi:hypothetical protein
MLVVKSRQPILEDLWIGSLQDSLQRAQADRLLYPTMGTSETLPGLPRPMALGAGSGLVTTGEPGK